MKYLSCTMVGTEIINVPLRMSCFVSKEVWGYKLEKWSLLTRFEVPLSKYL